jgi:hypothetical protein
MARTFSTSSQLGVTFGSTISGSMTLAAWINHTTASTAGYPANVDRWLCFGRTNDSFVIRREWNGATHGDSYVNATAGGRAQGGSVTVGVWAHWAVTANGSNIRLYKDGSQVASVAQTQAITADSTLRIGEASSEAFEGRFADVAFWNRALAASEIAMLAKGYSPGFLPVSLIDCFPLIRDLTGLRGNVLTDTSTTVGAHPRVYSPVQARTIAVPAVGGGAAVTYPQLERSVRGLNRGLTTGAY